MAGKKRMSEDEKHEQLVRMADASSMIVKFMLGDVPRKLPKLTVLELASVLNGLAGDMIRKELQS